MSRATRIRARRAASRIRPMSGAWWSTMLWLITSRNRPESVSLLSILGTLTNSAVASEIRTHFRLKAQAIREQLDRWQAMDDGNATAGDSMSAAGYVQHVQQVGGTVLGGKKDNSKASGSASDFGKKAEALRKLLDDLESGKIGDGPDV